MTEQNNHPAAKNADFDLGKIYRMLCTLTENTVIYAVASQDY